MSREMRAKQFAPFDALKGLQEALRLKEYENERVEKGEVTQEKAFEFSQILINYEKTNILSVTYFFNGRNYTIDGKAKIDCIEHYLIINNVKIKFDDIIDIKIK